MGDSKRITNPLRPLGYAFLYDCLVIYARRMGYALAIHGSLKRDLDLVACPWTDDAVSAEELAEMMREAVEGRFDETPERPLPERKPHGRLAWSILVGADGCYIDLSVMPREQR